MSKEYCIDTSGISNPLETMPIDIHVSLWDTVTDILVSGRVAVTQEIYDEMILIPGTVGGGIRSSNGELVLDVGESNWDWESYVRFNEQLQNDFNGFISEYNKGVKWTVGLNDITIIAQALTLGVPLVSMESSSGNSLKKMRIPDVCNAVGVPHLYFNDFLRGENITV